MLLSLDRHILPNEIEGVVRDEDDDFRHGYPEVHVNEISILNYRTAPSSRNVTDELTGFIQFRRIPVVKNETGDARLVSPPLSRYDAFS